MSTCSRASAAEQEVRQYPSLPTSVKGILFDMDGTLTDSDTLHFEAYRETFLKVCVLLLTPAAAGCPILYGTTGPVPAKLYLRVLRSSAVPGAQAPQALQIHVHIGSAIGWENARSLFVGYRLLHPSTPVYGHAPIALLCNMYILCAPCFTQVTPSFNGGEPITRSYYDDWMSGNSNTAIGERGYI